MEEIQVGEYCRTDKGIIFKVDKEKKNLDIVNFLDVEYGKIVKHSKNIIDLVEVGDIVNGKIVKHIALFEGFPNYPKLIFTDEKHLLPHETCENDDIKTILTHQQYENNIYRIGE